MPTQTKRDTRGVGKRFSSTEPTPSPKSCAAFTCKMTSPAQMPGQRGTCERPGLHFQAFPQQRLLPPAGLLLRAFVPRGGETSLGGARAKGKCISRTRGFVIPSISDRCREKVSGRFTVEVEVKKKNPPAGAAEQDGCGGRWAAGQHHDILQRQCTVSPLGVPSVTHCKRVTACCC